MNKISFKYTILALLMVFATMSSHAKEIHKELNNVIESYKKNHFLNAIYFISQNDDVLAHGVHGYYDLETKKTLEESQVMPTASITKQFTAAGILKLAEEGKLNIEDTISVHLPANSEYWSGNMPEWANKITIHQLLTHTHGIAEFIPEFKFNDKDPLKQILIGVMKFISAKPRKEKLEYDYNNSGYMILGLIIEHVSGKTVAEFFDQNLFAHLGMHNTRLITLEEAIKFQKGIDKNLSPAWYYIVPTNKEPSLQPIQVDFLLIPYAQGGAVSNANDLKLWNEALFSGKIISQKYLDMMLKPYYKTPNTILGKNTYYGYGIHSVQVPNGDIVYSHNGSALGISTSLMYEPKSKISVVVLSNMNLHKHLPKDYLDKIDFNLPQNQVDIAFFNERILNTLFGKNAKYR